MFVRRGTTSNRRFVSPRMMNEFVKLVKYVEHVITVTSKSGSTRNSIFVMELKKYYVTDVCAAAAVGERQICEECCERNSGHFDGVEQTVSAPSLKSYNYIISDQDTAAEAEGNCTYRSIVGGLIGDKR
jgi:hypothetical protein